MKSCPPLRQNSCLTSSRHRGEWPMEITKKKALAFFKWAFPIGFLAAAFAFWVYFFSPFDSIGVVEDAAARDIVQGWKQLAGKRQAKVIFARPPNMVILDLRTGIERVIANVEVAGGKGRFLRGRTPRPSWAPDGKRFIYRYDGNIYVCDESGNKKIIANKLMDRSHETRWSWYRADGQDWAVGPSKGGNAIMVNIADPTMTRLAYGGGDVVKHCEISGSGRYLVYATRRQVFVAPVGSESKEKSMLISSGQSCRPCAAPDNRVAWLPVPHTRYWIHDAATGRRLGALQAPPDEEIYRLNWSNDPDFAVHMYGSRGNERMHVRKISRGESLFIGSGWDPDLWVE